VWTVQAYYKAESLPARVKGTQHLGAQLEINFYHEGDGSDRKTKKKT
jgi:hypothetical protein